MPKKTVGELEAFVGTLKIADRIKVEWRVTGGGTPTSWIGVVKTQAADKKSMTVLYDGQGGEPYDFPPPVDEAEVWACEVVQASAKPSMKRTAELTSELAFNHLDISTWKDLLKDRLGIMLLLDRIRDRYHVPQYPDLSSRYQREEGRRLHLFEKQTILDMLEAWCMEHAGPTTV